MGDGAREEECRLDGEGSRVVGRFYAWWRGDPIPTLAPVPGLVAAVTGDAMSIAASMHIDIETFRERIRLGHRPWLARVGDEVVGWGWLATREASIGELNSAITLPPGERYAWDFVTVPAWRGRGVYPALVQAILRQDGAARYWIGHDEENAASARGVTKAGFGEVGAVRLSDDGGPMFVPGEPPDRAAAAAALLGLPVATL